MAEKKKEEGSAIPDEIKNLKDKCRLYELAFNVLFWEVMHRRTDYDTDAEGIPYFPEFDDVHMENFLVAKGFSVSEIKLFKWILNWGDELGAELEWLKKKALLASEQTKGET